MPRFSKKELLKLQKKFKTDAAIGKNFGITRQYVQILRKRYDIPPIPGARTVFPPPRFTEKELLRLQKKFKTDRAIGKKLGLKDSCVYSWRHKYGIPAIVPNNIKRNSKIISMAKRGMTGTAISKKIGVSVNQTCKIIRIGGIKLKKGPPYTVRDKKSLAKH